jgi:CheY-like chemotaxis protein
MERRRPRLAPTHPLILLADGHEDTRDLYATSLQSFGFEIATVDDGADAYDIPIVIVTSDAQPGARERATQEGCAAFFVKPCVPEVLATELRAVLNGRLEHPIGDE